MTESIHLFAGTKNGIFHFQSDFARKEWRIEGPWLRGWEILDLRLSGSGDPRLVVAGYHFMQGARILLSEGIADRWTPAAEGPSFEPGSAATLRRIWHLATGPGSGSEVIYAGTDEAALFISRDGGDRWRELAGVREHPTREEWVASRAGLCCHTIVPDPEDCQRVWIGISVVGVMRSEDGGESWHLKNGGLPIIVPSSRFPDLGSCVHHLALAPDGILYQQNHQGVFRSRDRAESWQRIHHGLPATRRERSSHPEVFGLPVAVHPAKPETVFVLPMEGDECRFCHAGKVAVYRSRDGGESWRDLRTGLPQEHQYASVLRHAFCLDDLVDCGVYFGTTSGQIFHSRDEGDTWHRIQGQLPRIISLRCYRLG